MSGALAWMPGALRAAGLGCEEELGWLMAGHGAFGVAHGVMLHHTACSLPGAMPDLNVLEQGRPDLKGPLCNLGLGRDGVFRAISANKAWHAGYGWWHGVTDGNGCFIGIEMENAGTGKEPWSQTIYDAALKGTAALLKHIGAAPIMCCGHKEYARTSEGKLGRKIDPITWDMDSFRKALERKLT